MYGGIEAGGTKFVCAIGSNPTDLRDEVRFATTTPDETIKKCIEYFELQKKKFKLNNIGVGSFGPLDLHPDSETYGYITLTNKHGWTNTNFLGKLKSSLEIPITIDTDVNAAALGEYYWGFGNKLSDFVYLTIGTGIGGGAMVNGKLLHGFNHPEMGHILLSNESNYKGVCNFHDDCLEGLASGPAIEKRWNINAEKLSEEHEAWDLQAEYLAKAIINYILILAPKRIILGGGVMEQEQLFPLVRKKVKEFLNGYIHLPEIIEDIDKYIVPPKLGNKAGILGAIALAKFNK
ncbi:MAG: ROK family protein [Ignavibacteriae bacterium]|nr:ROK family protein [Ignavibacteriota bacterium]